MIFIIPVSCLIVFAGVFIQCVIIKQDPKLQRGDVDIKSIFMRVALELGFITECALACKGLVTLFICHSSMQHSVCSEIGCTLKAILQRIALLIA